MEGAIRISVFRRDHIPVERLVRKKLAFRLPSFEIMQRLQMGDSGVNHIQCMRVHESYLPILVLNMHNELSIARRALNVGAFGYPTKDNKPEIMIAAIRKVVVGGRFIDPELAEQMVFESGSSDQRPS